MMLRSNERSKSSSNETPKRETLAIRVVSFLNMGSTNTNFMSTGTDGRKQKVLHWSLGKRASSVILLSAEIASICRRILDMKMAMMRRASSLA